MNMIISDYSPESPKSFCEIDRGTTPVDSRLVVDGLVSIDLIQRLGKLWGGVGYDHIHPNTPEINDLESYLDPGEI